MSRRLVPSLVPSLLLLLSGCGPAGVLLKDDTAGGVDSLPGETGPDNGGDNGGDNGDNGGNGGDNGGNGGDNGGNGGDNGGDNGGNGGDNGGNGGDNGGDSGGDTGEPDPGPVYDGGEGPHEVSDFDDEVEGVDVTYYVPAADGPFPIVVWSHGFQRSKENHVGAARRLASWGVIVATPNLTSWDHETNGETVANIVLPEAQRAFAADWDGSTALVGHSAGGLATMIAASLVEVDAVVSLDGVDMYDLGLDAAPRVSEPTLFLVGEPSYCNSDGNGTAWVDLVAGPRWRVDVTDACHCDFESDTDGWCTTFCGASDSGRQSLIQEYANAWVLHETVGGAEAWLEGGAEAEADRSAGHISW